MENELEIKVESQELLQEIIKTLPSEPEYFTIEMKAKSVSLPQYKEEGGEERYLLECSKNNIIPFSTYKFEYSHITGLFESKFDNNLTSIREQQSEKKKKAIMNGLVKGGRIGRFEFEIGISAQQGFKKFRDEILNMLLENDYQIDEGDLWLSWGRHTGYNEGYYRTGGLRFNIRKGVELELNGETSEEAKSKYIEWFNKLAVKYYI